MGYKLDWDKTSSRDEGKTTTTKRDLVVPPRSDKNKFIIFKKMFAYNAGLVVLSLEDDDTMLP